MSARLLISAAHKSSGKTTLSIGLCAALSAQGLRVQPFKKGPDYIDPMWLAQASGRACYNLDPYLMQPEQIAELFAEHSSGADISLVEGNKGLFDGLALDGSNSNAALAHLLDLPVVLVIDARGMTRGIAPLILGYQAFDRTLRIAGVILNRLGGSRHEAKLRAVIEHYTDVPVIGAVAEDSALAVTERHLGLMPSHEHDDAAQQVQQIGQRIAQQVDLQRLREVLERPQAEQPQAEVDAAPAVRTPAPATPQSGTLTVVPGAAAAATLPRVSVAPAQTAPAPSAIHVLHRPVVRAQPAAPLRIGLARDAAFGFYYPDDLQALERAGAQLLPFNTLQDSSLPPDLDGLFIGGGFPELFMQQLQDNRTLRQEIATALAQGLPAYAECGGLMYLAQSLQWRGQRCSMVGAIPGEVTMHDKPVGRGYVHLQATEHMPWEAWRGSRVRGHEFHYSSLDGLPTDTRYAWQVQRGHGVNGQGDGIVQGNLLASYSHLRDGAGAAWTQHFVAFVRNVRGQRSSATASAWKAAA
jgi:cobyrinic acid a,c-diamide synthase